MLRFASWLLFASLTASGASASTEPTAAEPEVTLAAGGPIQLFPSAAWLAATSKNVNVMTAPSDSNYMMTIAGNTLGGALVGFLIGGALYLIQDPDHRHTVNLAWWTGGGALVGVGAGVVQVIVSANRDSRAVSQGDTDASDERRVLGWWGQPHHSQ